MKVVVIGAGGIGGYIGGRLAEAGQEVTLVARGRHLEAIREGGLHIESPLGSAHIGNIPATDSLDGIGAVDLIVAAVKMPDLDDAMRNVPAVLHPETCVVTLQNGIDAKAVVGQYVAPDNIAQGIIYLAAYIKEPGRIMTPGGKHLMLVDSLGGNQTMQKFFQAVDQSVALDVTPVPDGDRIVWQKFTAQASIASVTSLTRLPLGGVFASPEAVQLLRQLISEAIAVANAKGILLDPNHLETTIALYGQQPAAQSSSLLVDIQAGKPTELAWLSGRVHTLGQELGVETPAHTAAWLALAPHKDGPATIRD